MNTSADLTSAPAAAHADTTTTAGPPLPGALRLGVARTGLELKQFFRERSSVIFTFSFPLIMLFIFGSVFSKEIAPGVSFRQYFAAGMIASGIIMSSFQSLAISIAIEREEGTLKRLNGTPMPPAAYFLGKIGLVLVTSLLQSAILLGVGASLYHLHLPSSAELWLRFAWIFVLGTSAGTVLGISYSSLVHSAKSAGAVVSPVVVVLQFISGVYFVYTDLPSWMKDVGSAFPLKWLAQGLRSVFLPSNFAEHEASHSWQLPQIALVLTAWTVVGLIACMRTFRWQRPGSR